MMQHNAPPLLMAALLLIGCNSERPSDVAPVPDPQPQQQASTGQPEASRSTTASAPSAEQVALINRVRGEVEDFCADCHAMPRPASSPAHEWQAEVDQGFMLYRTSGRSDLKVPDEKETLEFFRLQAPNELPLDPSILDYPPTSLSLRTQTIRYPGNRPPAVTNVRWASIGMHDDAEALIYCNINTGAVMASWPQSDDPTPVRLATLLQPVHAEPCDLDADGNKDLLVSDIGEFNADDSDLGRVVWLRGVDDASRFEQVVLAEGLSRVSDARAGDFDNDGDLDVLVAAFGWRNTGQIMMLVNEGSSETQPISFTQRQVDPRHGAVHVIPTDLNDDGHLDFVGLISQEHEVVEAFLNDGKGNFSPQTIWAAPDPAYGSSGIQLVDMDGDEDLDVLYTNGDSFDRGAKPHHSIQWLENAGEYPYKHHHILPMPGVLNAEAADFDGDGDVDIVACSLLAGPLKEELSQMESTSVVMLEQTEPGTFKPTQVEARNHQHISLQSGDFDHDGDTDFAVGTFAREGHPQLPDVVVYWNESATKTASR